MKKEHYQEIYINLDDSGKLSHKEEICVIGGIIFFSKHEKDKFITQYRSIINEIKCKYCPEEKNLCHNSCPEIKNTNISPTDKRRIMNYLKKYFTIALTIENNLIYDYIMDNKASKGRYLDYTIRKLIKETIKLLIKYQKIDPQKPVKLVINIDEQSTKSNGYYNLKDGLTEELIHGIINFDYQKNFPPILYNKLEIILSYQNSEKSYVVQASDLLAGSIRKEILEAKKEAPNYPKTKLDFKITFP